MEEETEEEEEMEEDQEMEEEDEMEEEEKEKEEEEEQEVEIPPLPHGGMPRHFRALHSAEKKCESVRVPKTAELIQVELSFSSSLSFHRGVNIFYPLFCFLCVIYRKSW